MLFRSMRKKNRMNKEGVALALHKLVILILVVVAILLSFWAMSRFGLLEMFRNLFPDFSSGDSPVGTNPYGIILGLIK